MSTKIQRLSESLVRKIAAGEVIERPASVVKELVENALDAGAQRIRIELVDGGRQGICVVDDGAGMSRDDVELCVERHTTSKLRSPTDLFTIDTLGFRGEALASVAAVARLTIESRTEDDHAGTRLVVEGGVRRDFGATARDVGTTIDVAGLFFNTPARRKFLRHSDSEMRYATQAVVHLAAAYPYVAFQLIHGGRDILEFHPGDHRARAAELLNAEPDDLLPVDDQGGDGRGIRVTGFVAPPAGCRRSRARQFVVVRRRPIVARAVVNAVYAGYGTLLPYGAHPQFVLWLDLDPRQVDVNVHPTKREVRFADEPAVRSVVQDGVRSALRIPEARAYASGSASYASSASVSGNGWLPVGVAERPARDLPRDLASTASPQMNLDLLAPAAPVGEPVVEGSTARADLDDAQRAEHIWQIHDKYLLLPVRDGLLVVDQHVAHERVRFEEVLDLIAAQSAASQRLLVPLTLEVNPVEMAAFRQSLELFEKIGFGVREFGPTTVLVDAIPPDLRNWGDGDLLYEILSDLVEELDARSEAREAMAATMACHTSVRAGDRLAPMEMVTLVKRLLAARDPFACPHGRPILVKIPLRELDRLFHRT